MFEIPNKCPVCGFGGLLPTYVRQPWIVKLFARWIGKPVPEDFMAVQCTQCDYKFAVPRTIPSHSAWQEAQGIDTSNNP